MQSSNLQMLNEIARVVSSTLDLRTLYDTIYLQIGRVVDTTHFFVAEDVVARYGGEEFCVLLPEIPLGDAEIVAERLRSFIDRYQLPQAAGTKHIAVSIGMALLDLEDQSEELFTRADLAMYQVKYVGGNRVCIADSPSDFRFRQAAG